MATSNPASDIVNKKTEDTALATGLSSDLMKTVLPYAVAIIAQVPMMILYYRQLALRPHYSGWVYFAIIATAALAWSRWPKDDRQKFMDSIWSNILLFVGLAFGLAGVLYVEPWFAAMSVFTLVASLLARTIDRDTGRSLWVVSLPLFVSLKLPMNYDFKLISWLQNVSANLTSRLLDLIGIAHFMPGNVITTPTNEYGIEEACSGIQSFFLLVFVSVAFCVWMRRPLFRSLLLFAAAIFWSVFMNCLRICLIPVFDVYMNIDLSEGIAHDLLGWSTMTLGVLLLLSTDQFLMFLLGPVDAGTGSSGPLGKFITNFWNSLIAGQKEDDEVQKRRKSRRKPLTGLSQGLAWAVAAMLVVGGLLAMWEIKNSLSTPNYRIRFFGNQVVFPLNETALPEMLKDWKLVKFESESRGRASDLGEKSDQWIYQSPNRFYAIASLDQPFPGWHELSRCYGGGFGWKVKERLWKPWEETEVGADGQKKEWPYVEVHLEKPTGERGLLLFSLFDGFGEAYVPPRTWGFWAHLAAGAQNRLATRARGRLFQGEAYQTQVFVSGYGELSKKERDEITDRYLEIREIMRSEFLKTKSRELGVDAETASTATASNDAEATTE